MLSPRPDVPPPGELGGLRSWVARGEALAGRAAQRWGPNVLPFLSLLAVAATLCTWWCWLDLQRLALAHLPVYDLGVEYQAIWAAAHGYRTDASGPLGFRLFIYLFLPAYFLAPSGYAFLEFLLVVQNIVIFLGALPVYLVARDRLGSRAAATALGLAYLVYPALNGPLWFPFHYEPFFATLFLFAYWRYRAGAYRSAGALLALSVFTNIGAPIVVALFGLGILIEPRLPPLLKWLRRIVDGDYALPNLRGWIRWPGPRDRFAVAILGWTVALFVGIIAYYGLWPILYFIGQVSFAPGAGLSRALPIDPLATGQLKLTTLLIAFLPVLGLPILAREERWSLLPFLVAAVLTPTHYQFLFPFKDQYVAFLYPGIFAGTIRGLERLEARKHRLQSWAASSPQPSGPFRRWRYRMTPVRYSAAVLVAVLAASSVLAPWSPGNHVFGPPTITRSAYYPVASMASGNATVAAHLLELEAQVPSSSALLLQNNLPLTMDRSDFYVPGFYYLGDPLDYLINDPYDIQFYAGQNFGPEPHSMMDWSNYFLAQNSWGVAAESDGALLLEHGYSGPPRIYHPLYERLGPSEFPQNTSTILAANDTTGPRLLAAGPKLPIDQQYSAYSPGTFEFRVTLTVHDPTAADRLVVQVGADGGALPLVAKALNGSNWTGLSGAVVISFSVKFAQYYPGMYFAVELLAWAEPVTFDSLVIVQTAAVPSQEA